MPYLRNKKTGQVIFVPDGGGQGVAPNPLKVAEAQAGLGQTAATTNRTQVQTQGDALNNAITRATLPAQIRKTTADADRASADAQARAAEVAFARSHNGLNRQQWNDGRGALDQMAALNRSVASLRDQYRKNFKGKGIGSALEYLPAMMRPANGVFNNTANSLLADMAKAKGLTSQQFNTPAEQKMFFQPMIPNASDTDEEIVGKIDALQRMVNDGTTRYARQLGKGVVGNSTAPASAKSNVIDFKDLP